MKAAIDICSGGETSITLTVLENTMQVPCTHVSGDRGEFRFYVMMQRAICKR